MSNMKNSTSPSKVGGNSMFFTMEKGDTSRWWPSFQAKPGMGKAEGRKPANPHGGGKMPREKDHY